MGARKGAARVGVCLVPLENNLFVEPFSPSCGEGGRLFSYRGPFFFFLCHFFYAGGGGGGAFSHYVQNVFGAHALVARVIANVLFIKCCT